MILVTVEVSRTANIEYLISVSKDNKTIQLKHSAGGDAGGAAAAAIRATMEHVGQYYIIAPSEVMEFIPEAVRSGMMNL